MPLEPIQNRHDIDWRTLRRLRSAYLECGPIETDYWKDEHDLLAYDMTFAQRIAWKWDAVLADLARIGWQPPGGRILDWGCGSGIATRLVLSAFPGLTGRAVQFFDRSEHAMSFAGKRCRAVHPRVPQETVDEPDLLIISHVLGELNGTGEGELERAIRRSASVLWVEPGAREISAKLAAFRSRLLDTFEPVAPCTHGGVCGLTDPANARHWCHFFAHAPAEVHSDPDWAAFARELQIDVRTVPYSYLVLQRRPANAAPAARDPRLHRIIGRPRLYKGHAKVLSCGAEGVADLLLLQRTDRDLHRAFHKERFNPVQAMDVEDGKITRIG